jgi:hypothetical protein
MANSLGNSEFKNTKKRDKFKNDFCEKNGILILRINYKLKPLDIKNKIINFINIIKEG